MQDVQAQNCLLFLKDLLKHFLPFLQLHGLESVHNHKLRFRSLTGIL